jgi:hypothetical protein
MCEAIQSVFTSPAGARGGVFSLCCGFVKRSLSRHP